LLEYRQLEGYICNVLSAENMAQVKNVKLSARNSLKGKIVTIKKGVITPKIKI